MSPLGLSANSDVFWALRVHLGSFWLHFHLQTAYLGGARAYYRQRLMILSPEFATFSLCIPTGVDCNLCTGPQPFMRWSHPCNPLSVYLKRVCPARFSAERPKSSDCFVTTKTMILIHNHEHGLSAQCMKNIYLCG